MWINENVIRLSDVSQDVWSSVLESLRRDLSPTAFDMWFNKGNLDFGGIENGRAKLVAANPLIVSWINGHFREALLSAFQKVLPEVSTFEIDVSGESKASPVPIIPSSAIVPEHPRTKSPRGRGEKEKAETLATLYPEYSFENFVEGDSNRMALAMCRSIAENPGECSMNPLILFGGSGVGKTHLLQSIGCYAVTFRTARKVVFRTAERFLKDFMRTQTAASRDERTASAADLRRTYEDSEILLLDDIQFLAGKGHGATEKALFDILRKRLAAKRPTVFCADRRLSEIPNLYEGFVRFDGNGIAVNAPDSLTRASILRRKTEKLSISAEDSAKIFDWAATHGRGDVRELEGLVTKLSAYRDLLGVNPTFEIFRELYEPAQPAGSDKPEKRLVHTIASIKEKVAFAYGTTAESLRANSRVQSISLPRKLAMYFCRELTRESLSNIGFHFDRDYSTVIASVKSVEREMRRDPNFAAEVEKLRETLES